MRSTRKDITTRPDTAPVPKDAASRPMVPASVQIAAVSGWERVKVKTVDVLSAVRPGRKEDQSKDSQPSV
jgi:hypothetical protein